MPITGDCQIVGGTNDPVGVVEERPADLRRKHLLVRIGRPFHTVNVVEVLVLHRRQKRIHQEPANQDRFADLGDRVMGLQPVHARGQPEQHALRQRIAI
mgnify:CR=1 FL=1